MCNVSFYLQITIREPHLKSEESCSGRRFTMTCKTNHKNKMARKVTGDTNPDSGGHISCNLVPTTI